MAHDLYALTMSVIKTLANLATVVASPHGMQVRWTVDTGEPAWVTVDPCNARGQATVLNTSALSAHVQLQARTLKNQAEEAAHALGAALMDSPTMRTFLQGKAKRSFFILSVKGKRPLKAHIQCGGMFTPTNTIPTMHATDAAHAFVRLVQGGPERVLVSHMRGGIFARHAIHTDVARSYAPMCTVAPEDAIYLCAPSPAPQHAPDPRDTHTDNPAITALQHQFDALDQCEITQDVATLLHTFSHLTLKGRPTPNGWACASVGLHSPNSTTLTWEPQNLPSHIAESVMPVAHIWTTMLNKAITAAPVLGSWRSRDDGAFTPHTLTLSLRYQQIVPTIGWWGMAHPDPIQALRSWVHLAPTTKRWIVHGTKSTPYDVFESIIPASRPSDAACLMHGLAGQAFQLLEQVV